MIMGGLHQKGGPTSPSSSPDASSTGDSRDGDDDGDKAEGSASTQSSSNTGPRSQPDVPKRTLAMDSSREGDVAGGASAAGTPGATSTPGSIGRPRAALQKTMLGPVGSLSKGVGSAPRDAAGGSAQKTSGPSLPPSQRPAAPAESTGAGPESTSQPHLGPAHELPETRSSQSSFPHAGVAPPAGADAVPPTDVVPPADAVPHHVEAAPPGHGAFGATAHAGTAASLGAPPQAPAGFQPPPSAMAEGGEQAPPHRISVPPTGDPFDHAASVPLTKRKWFWPVVGCGAVVLLLCPLSVMAALYLMKSKLSDSEDALRLGHLQTQATITLGLLERECEADPSGATAERYAHERVRSTLKSQLCQVNKGRISSLAEDATLELAEDSNREDLVESLDLDPEQCIKISKGAALVVGCDTETDGFQLVALEGIETL